MTAFQQQDSPSGPSTQLGSLNDVHELLKAQVALVHPQPRLGVVVVFEPLVAAPSWRVDDALLEHPSVQPTAATGGSRRKPFRRPLWDHAALQDQACGLDPARLGVDGALQDVDGENMSCKRVGIPEEEGEQSRGWWFGAAERVSRWVAQRSRRGERVGRLMVSDGENSYNSDAGPSLLPASLHSVVDT